MAEIARDPAFHLADIYDLSKDQIRERTMEKFASLVHYVTTEPLDVFNYRMQVSSQPFPEITRFQTFRTAADDDHPSLRYSLSAPSILGSGQDSAFISVCSSVPSAVVHPLRSLVSARNHLSVIFVYRTDFAFHDYRLLDRQGCDRSERSYWLFRNDR